MAVPSAEKDQRALHLFDLKAQAAHGARTEVILEVSKELDTRHDLFTTST